ncbi:hypothetical protein GCM10022227_39130 [Streptomyces sedi]
MRTSMAMKGLQKQRFERETGWARDERAARSTDHRTPGAAEAPRPEGTTGPARRVRSEVAHVRENHGVIVSIPGWAIESVQHTNGIVSDRTKRPTDQAR